MMFNVTRLIVLCLLTFPSLPLSAAPTSEEMAIRVVENWRTTIAKPLGSEMGTEISSVITFTNDNGETLYHIVSMTPDGFVVVAGDDQVEPIIAFVADGAFDAESDNPLYSMVSSDLPSRVEYVRNREKQSRSSSVDDASIPSQADRNIRKAENKWAALGEEHSQARRGAGLAVLADVRVAPLLTTKWNQKGYHSSAGLSYNRYSPQNRHAGCVAVALAQVMRYHEHDAAPPTTSGRYYVDDYQHGFNAPFFGGDGQGSAYNWSLMSDGSLISNEDSAIAIGRLLFDAAISVRMLFEAHQAGAQLQSTSGALTQKFGYSNVRLARYMGNDAPGIEIRNTILNTNLDAGLPLLAGIGGNGGHAVNSDGYGYDSGTLYHHMNMGWGGRSNAWYNLPDIGSFSSVGELVYNIYIEGTGEIISGRVTDTNGQAITNAIITAQTGTDTYTATTNDKGIYALMKVPSNASFSVSVTKNGYSFAAQQVQTKESIPKNIYGEGVLVGNVWGVDFQGMVASANSGAIIFPVLYLLE